MTYIEFEANKKEIIDLLRIVHGKLDANDHTFDGQKYRGSLSIEVRNWIEQIESNDDDRVDTYDDLLEKIEELKADIVDRDDQLKTWKKRIESLEIEIKELEDRQ